MKNIPRRCYEIFFLGYTKIECLFAKQMIVFFFSWFGSLKRTNDLHALEGMRKKSKEQRPYQTVRVRKRLTVNRFTQRLRRFETIIRPLRVRL